MSTGTHYIGSKISLISKAEIRYEGVLYQVDTKEATVTLAKVRSFGTENRPAQKVIPPRNETYEFIIFRGSDIKDLVVSEMTKTSTEEDSTPQDPAILSAQSMAPPATSTLISQAPPTTSSQMTQPPPSMPSAHPPPPPHVLHPGSSGGSGTGGHAYSPFPPPSMGGFSPFGMPYFRPPHMMPGGAPPPHAFAPLPTAHPHAAPGAHQTVGPSPPHPQPPGGQPQSQLPRQGLLPSSQPLLPHPPPQIVSSSQKQPPLFPLPQPQIITPPKTASIPAVPPAPTSVVETPSVAPGNSETKPQASSTPLMTGLLNSSAPETTPKASLPLDSESPGAPKNTLAHPPVQVDPPPPQTSAAVAPSSMKEPPSSTTTSGSMEGKSQSSRGGRSGGGGGGEGQRTGSAGERRRQNQTYNSQQNRRGNQSHGGRGDYRGPPRGNRPPRRGGQEATFRYDSEFDFESANARFDKEGLEEEFKQKLNVDDHSSTHSRRTSEGNEGAESPASDDVIVDDVAGGIEGDEDGGADGDYYDKSKSFFDNITCESGSSGSNHRPSRNEEREMNTETFGVSSVRGYGYRGYRRGRGRGGRGRGYGGYYRGRGGRYQYGRGGGSGGGAYQQKGRGGNSRRGNRGNYQEGQYYSQQRRTQEH